MERSLLVCGAWAAVFAVVAGAQEPLQLREAVRAACGWRENQQDRSVLGDGLRVGDLEADAGIGTHAPAELVWNVPAGRRWFAAWFGVTHERQRNGSVTLHAFVDGKERFASPVRRGGEAALWVVVPVDGGRELRLVVGDGGDGNGSDHANLLLPRWHAGEAAPGPERPPATTFVGEAAAPDGAHVLWSRRPARVFTEAYPLGDGRIGATWFGGVGKDRIVLNEISMWSGKPEDANRPLAHRNLPAIVDLLRNGKNVAAEKLVNATFTCQGAGSGGGNGKDVPFGCYQTFGDLEITTLGPDGQPLAGEIRDYRRTSFLGTEGQEVTFIDAAGHRHRRVLRIRRNTMDLDLLCDAPSDLVVRLRRRENATVTVVDGKELRMQGQLGDGVRFAARVAGMDRGVADGSDGIRIVGQKELYLSISFGTDFAGLGKAPERATPVDELVPQVFRPPGIQLPPDYAPHLDLAGHDRRALPTVERLTALANGAADPDLFALYFHYGAWLLEHGGGGRGLPLNLQGLWAPEYQTPWNGDYHLNVNVQMNYWPALPFGRFGANLALVGLVESLVAPGTKTAQAYYGAPGWVAHTITNVWGFTAPGEHASWGSAHTSSAWLCRHLAEHWAFTQDRAFLQRVYPTLRESARFYRHILVDAGDGTLVTPVSNSPENAFRMANGDVASVCMGPTIDQQILRELFTNVAEAARLLGVDADLAADLTATAAKLAPHRIGKHGQLQEWLVDYDEPEPHHRHVSHLYGLYPSDQITPFGTPELAKAARVTLERRGDDGTGWSLAFKANLWARLGDGDRALAVLTKLCKPVGVPGFEGGHGGSYANLFCAHPPFQIDGNLGGAAAIAEMLLQSHRERPGEDFTVHLLPALPKAWPQGRVDGLWARGAIKVDQEWAGGVLVRATLVNTREEPRSIRLRTARPVRVAAGTEPVPTTSPTPGVLAFTLPARSSVEVTAVE
ncbi:MAG: glycoside hydrolase N-terminal domain-containing protein [Planctomycetes bacterium]|nr:glycoside hydrolase N-terminal domain-containing protein [Planctomycetota bacterium]